MKTLRDILVGLLSIIASTLIVFGSISLSLVEGNQSLSLTATPGVTLPAMTPSVALTQKKPTMTIAAIVPTQCGAPNNWVHYVVQPGDTIQTLSRASGVSEQQLRTANCFNATDTILTGDIIFVPHLIVFTPTPTSSTPTVGPAGTLLAPTSLITQATISPNPGVNPSSSQPIDSTSTSTVTPAPLEVSTKNP